jgi:multidrug transporter EmrE-like cation transporter
MSDRRHGRRVSTPLVLSLTGGCLAGAVLVAFALRVGAVDLGVAKALWAGLCFIVIGAIVLRARGHWASWLDRQLSGR